MAEERFSIIYDGKYLAGKAAKQAQKDINKVTKTGEKARAIESKSRKRYEKELTAHQKSRTALIKKQQKEIPTIKKGIDLAKQSGAAEKHVQKMLKMTAGEYKNYAKNLQTTGKYSKIATEIQEKGLKSVSAASRNNLKIESDRIEAMRTAGVVAPSAIRKQQDAILSLNQSLNKNMTVWGKLQGGVGKVMGAIKKVGMTFLTLIGPLFLVGAATRVVTDAVRWATAPFIEFEDAMYELRKTAGLTMEAMHEIGNEIERLTIIVPLTAKELGNIAATAGRLGIRGTQDILTFTKTVAKMSIATDLTAEEAAQALGKLTAAFEIPIENVLYLSSVINELSNITASSASDIVEAMKRVGASGKLLGFAAEEVAVMTSTLIDMGMAAQRSGTRLRRLFTEMARKSHLMAKQMDVDAEAWKETIEKDPMTALITYLTYLKELPSVLDQATKAHNVFGKVGGFAAISIAQNLESVIKNLEVANHEMLYATSLTEEYAIAVSKTSAELQILTNRAELARREFGEKTIPVLKATKKAWADLLMELSGTSYAQLRVREGTEETTGAMVSLRSQIEPISDDLEKLPQFMNDMADSFIKVDMTGKKIGFGEPVGEIRKLSQDTLDLIPVIGNYDDALGRHLIQQDAVTDGNEYLLASTGKVVLILKENGKWTDVLEKKEEELKDAKIAVGIASDYENSIENSLNELRRNEPKNIAEITLKEDELATARVTQTKFKEEYSQAENDIAKSVYESGKAVAWSTDITKEDSKAIERSAEIYEYVIDTLYPLGTKNMSQMFAVLRDGTDLTKEWGGIVGEETAKGIENFTIVEERIAYMDKSLKDAGYTIKWVAGLPAITVMNPEDVLTVEEMRKAMKRVGITTDIFKGHIYDLQTATNKLRYEELELLDARDSLTESTWDLFGAGRGLLDQYSSMYNTLDRILDLEEDVAIAGDKVSGSQEGIARAIRQLNKQMGNTSDMERRAEIEDNLALHGMALTDRIIESYRKRFDEVDKLIKEGIKLSKNEATEIEGSNKIIEAALLARGIATEINENANIALTDTEREAYKNVMGWGSDKLSLMEDETKGILDYDKKWNETLGTIKESGKTIETLFGTDGDIAKSKSDLEEYKTLLEGITITPELANLVDTNNWQNVFKDVNMIAARIMEIPSKEITLNMDEESFWETWQLTKTRIEKDPLNMIIDIRGITTEIAGLTLSLGEEIEDSLQFGGRIPQTGLYELHRGEEVIPAHEVRNYDKKDININIRFGGSVPAGVSEAEIKEVVRNEIARAVRANY